MKRFVLGAVVGLALASGVAYATIPDAGGVIHACMLNKIGTIRIIDPSQGQRCSTSLGGTRGPTGPKGDPGQNGSRGATGPRGA